MDTIAIRKRDRAIEFLQESQSEVGRLVGEIDVDLQDRKFIPAQARNGIPLADMHFQPLARLFQNLIENAERYADPDRSPRLEISAVDEGASVRLDFADNGVGIDPRFQETIFGMFRRVDTTKKGTGIGLAAGLFWFGQGKLRLP